MGRTVFQKISSISSFFFNKKYFKSDEESFWENHPFESFWENHSFEDSLEKADGLCEIGYNFPKNEIIYKKISEKK